MKNACFGWGRALALRFTGTEKDPALATEVQHVCLHAKYLRG